MRSAQEYRQIKVHHIEFGEDLVVTLQAPVCIPCRRE